MTAKILVLDEKVISQIAAGEVIERPSSVVKELVENSLDAQADQVFIEIEDGGKKSIKVSDNGLGMSREDAEKAFFRHSTSKIINLRDLESITSLGFRGEALASIAAVGKVTLITKAKEDPKEGGCEIEIHGGKTKHVKDAAANFGTTVYVKELFYNTPARRKYLKSTRAELARITDSVTRQALIHPEIFFKLIHNSKEIISSPKADSQRDNIAYILGKDIAREMLPVNYSSHDLNIQGYVSKPALTRKSQSHISIFVNKRYVSSRLLSSAVREGYSDLVMKNRYPIAVLSLTVPPRSIDVNVHPSKLEIRFEDEKKVRDSLVFAVEKTLKTEVLVPEVGHMKLETPELEAFRIPKNGGHQIVSATGTQLEAGRQVNIDEFERDAKANISPLPSHDDTARLPKMAIVGQLLNTYIVAQSGDSVLIIDQHAAHERVLFERLRSIFEKDRKDRQELLSPLTIELSAKQRSFVDANSGMLDSLGFRMEHFGGNTFHVRSVPVVFVGLESESTIHDIIDDLLDFGKSKQKDELVRKAAAVVACHSAIRAGEELTTPQMRNLVLRMHETENAYSCPHGRPSVLSLSKYELEKLFRRK